MLKQLNPLIQSEPAAWQKYRSHINKMLEELLVTDEAPQAHLYEAARYAALGQGKRLRPLLCLLSAEMFGAPMVRAIQPAAALEIIHTYSLIHDDLPCMDNDDYRRGRLTVHKAYDEGLALLTGDFLLTYAFELLSNAPHLSADSRIKLVQYLARSCGGNGMVGGQVRDISSENQTLTLQELKELHIRKTGMLINASILFGAIIAEQAPPEELEQLGIEMGLAFQIVDDILDIIDSKDKRGSDVPSDIANNKTTYVTLLGIEGAKKEASACLDRIEGFLNKMPLNTQPLMEAANWIVKRIIG